jgi:hypothetical protein
MTAATGQLTGPEKTKKTAAAKIGAQAQGLFQRVQPGQGVTKSEAEHGEKDHVHSRREAMPPIPSGRRESRMRRTS